VDIRELRTDREIAGSATAKGFDGKIGLPFLTSIPRWMEIRAD